MRAISLKNFAMRRYEEERRKAGNLRKKKKAGELINFLRNKEKEGGGAWENNRDSPTWKV